jgi:hypothetical protein
MKLLFTVCEAGANEYAYLAVTGTSVIIHASANLSGKVLNRANPGGIFIAEKDPVTNVVNG